MTAVITALRSRTSATASVGRRWCTAARGGLRVRLAPSTADDGLGITEKQAASREAHTVDRGTGAQTPSRSREYSRTDSHRKGRMNRWAGGYADREAERQRDRETVQAHWQRYCTGWRRNTVDCSGQHDTYNTVLPGTAHHHRPPMHQRDAAPCSHTHTAGVLRTTTADSGSTTTGRGGV
jgi:hypothetical protein